MSDTHEGIQRAECFDCGHRWIIAYLPMELGKFAQLCEGAACPKCGATSERLGLLEAEPVTPEQENNDG